MDSLGNLVVRRFVLHLVKLIFFMLLKFLEISLILILVNAFGCKMKKEVSINDNEPEVKIEIERTYLSQQELNSYLTDSTNLVTPNVLAPPPFNDIEYDKVVAYDFDSGDGTGAITILNKQNNLATTIKRQQALNQIQVNELTNLLGSKTTYGDSPSFCFVPRLGIVFYKKNKAVLILDICLECNRLRSSLTIPATKAVQFEHDDETKYPAEGFSETGRDRLSTICSELQFSHCKEE